MKKILVPLFFLAVFGIYLYTLYPVPAPEDSGGYTAISYLLDIAHAPGNPLYVIIAKIFTLLPLGNIAYRVNLLSAFFGILALLVIYRMLLFITKQSLAALIVPSFLAFTYEFWYTTTFAKTFTMICFFAVLALYLLLRFLSGDDRKYLYVACYCTGMGIGVHYFLLIFIPVLVLAMLLKRKELGIKNWLISLVLIILGVSVYLYLPLRSGAHPLINFGQPDNLQRLMSVLLRKDWSFFKMSATAGSPMSIGELFGRFQWFFVLLSDHLCVIGLIIAVMGFIVLWGKQKNIFFIVSSLVILAGPVWLIFSAFPLVDPFREAMNERFLPVFECLLAVPFGLGLNEIILYLERNSRKITGYAFIFLFLLPLLVHIKTVSKRYNFLAEDYAANFFKPLERGSAFFAGQHVNSVSMYYQYVRCRRNDVARIIEPSVFLELLQKCYGTNVPIYADPSYNNYFSLPVDGNFRGLNIKFNPRVKMEELAYPWELFCYRGNFRSGSYKDFYSQMVLMWYMEAISGYGKMCIKFKKYDEAIKAFKRCISIGIYDDKFRSIRTYNYDKIKPGSQSAYIGILEAYTSAGDIKAAEELCISLSRAFPRSSLVNQYLSLIYLNQGKLGLAKTYGEKAVALAPEDLTANLNLGVIYERLENYALAISQYEKAVKINPESETACYNLGSIYYRQKNWNKVIEYFSKTLELNPDRKILQTYIDRARGEQLKAVSSPPWRSE